MRVGFFTYGMGDKLTGIGRYTVEVTRALRDLGEGLEIILINPYPDSEIAWYREFENHPVPRLAKVPLAASLGNVVLDRVARQLRLDVLHDPCGIAPFFFPKGPYARVTTIHDAVPLVMPEVQPLATRLIFRTLIPAARFTADAVITISHASARDLGERAGIPKAKLHPIHYGMSRPPELTRQEICATLERLEIEAPYFLFVGAINPRKNIARILEAFERVQADRPEVKLVVVGPKFWGADDTFAQVQDAAGVVFTGYVSDNDLHALYYGARALVWPSLYEGFGLPPLEAMIHGTPVLTSNVSSLPEVVGDTALTVDPYDVDAIVEGMQRLLEDEDFAADLGRRGRARAQTFTWEENARKTLAVYRQVLG